jgi:hypothetical protein
LQGIKQFFGPQLPKMEKGALEMGNTLNFWRFWAGKCGDLALY